MTGKMSNQEIIDQKPEGLNKESSRIKETKQKPNKAWGGGQS